MPTDLVSCIATLVVKSPWPGCGGGSQLDAALRLGKARRVERAVQGGEELVTDHGRSRAARHGFGAPHRGIVAATPSGHSPRFDDGTAAAPSGVSCPAAGDSGKETGMQPTGDGRVESLVDSRRRNGSGLATIYGRSTTSSRTTSCATRRSSSTCPVSVGRCCTPADARSHNDEAASARSGAGPLPRPARRRPVLDDLGPAHARRERPGVARRYALSADTRWKRRREPRRPRSSSCDDLPGVLAVGFSETRRPRHRRAPGRPRRGRRAGPRRHGARDKAPRGRTPRSRSSDGATVPRVRTETRLRLIEVTTDPAAGEIAVHLARGEERAVGRASSAHGLLGVVEATVYAVRTFLPDLTYLPGWARTIETTPDRRFIVVASVTDPEARSHLRGAAEGRDAARRGCTRDAGNLEPNDQPRALMPCGATARWNPRARRLRLDRRVLHQAARRTRS